MVNLPGGMIGMWQGTDASIPANWSRVTALDGQFPRYTSGAPGGTGGTANHSHTGASAHTHSNAHTHVGSSSGAAVGMIGADNSAPSVKGDHTHGLTLSSQGGTSSSTDPSYPSLSNEALHDRLIFIESDGSTQMTLNVRWFGIKDLASASILRETARSRYLRGATALGDTEFSQGTFNHTHSDPGHTHTGGGAHTHSVDFVVHAVTGDAADDIGDATNDTWSVIHRHPTGGSTDSIDHGDLTATPTDPGSADHTPPTLEMSIYTAFPADTDPIAGACFMRLDSTVDPGWLVCDSSAPQGIPDPEDYFAEGSSFNIDPTLQANAGTSHDHTHFHAHPLDGTATHTSPTLSASAEAVDVQLQSGAASGSDTAHTHAGAATNAQSNSPSASINLSTETHLPPFTYVRLLVLNNANEKIGGKEMSEQYINQMTRWPRRRQPPHPKRYLAHEDQILPDIRYQGRIQ
jgi:hypothetical protein